jgi:predicted PurR-regulated permease PerM
LIGPVAAQVLDLASALPDRVARLQENLTQFVQGHFSDPAAINFIQNRAVAGFAAWAADFVGALVGVFADLGGLVADSILVLIISVYMVLGGRQIHAAAHALFPETYGARFLFVTRALGLVLGGYIRGQLVLAGLLGVVVGVGLFLLGMPYALLLGVLAMVLGLIPMFGSALSAVPALFVALTQPWPTVLWVLIFFIIVQNVQDQVLAPRLQGSSLGLHPLAVLFALLAGAQLAGWFGAIFALPIAGFIWILTVALYRTFFPSTRGPAAEGAPTLQERSLPSG